MTPGRASFTRVCPHLVTRQLGEPGAGTPAFTPCPSAVQRLRPPRHRGGHQVLPPRPPNGSPAAPACATPRRPAEAPPVPPRPAPVMSRRSPATSTRRPAALPRRRPGRTRPGGLPAASTTPLKRSAPTRLHCRSEPSSRLVAPRANAQSAKADSPSYAGRNRLRQPEHTEGSAPAGSGRRPHIMTRTTSPAATMASSPPARSTQHPHRAASPPRTPRTSRSTRRSSGCVCRSR